MGKIRFLIFSFLNSACYSCWFDIHSAACINVGNFSFWVFNEANFTIVLICLQIDRSGKIPMLRFRDRESYAGNKTKEYDDIAMKYLSYVLFFLVACSSVYSLMYERHKSWYSWILSSLTSCVYMFGKLLFSSIHALSSIFFA
jgi:hypothetical protein